MESILKVFKRTYKFCYYRIGDFPDWKVIGRRVHGLGRARFEVYQNDILQYILKQPNILTLFLSKVPFIMPFFESPFYFYRHGARCGRWKVLKNPTFCPGKWEFYFEDVIYRLELGPYYSFNQFTQGEPWKPQDILFMNGTRVATYTRCFRKEHSIVNVEYLIKYTEEIGKRPDILLLFGAFLENYLNRDKGNGATFN